MLFSRLCTTENLFLAWKQVKSKGSAGGIDGISLLGFEDKLEFYLKELQNDLQTHQWVPEPYLRVEIKKNETEKRKLGLLSIKDKIVQQAIRRLIEPTFERIFLSNSYGYRPRMGHLKAIRRVRHEFGVFKDGWVVRLDIDNYFDSINHEILFQRLKGIIHDEEIIRLIELSVKMGIVNKKLKWSDVENGVPQGAILSPLLANFYLHPFDKFICNNAKSYIRYADDFLIITETKDEAINIQKEASDFLQKRLSLTLNEPKIYEIKAEIEFLGVLLKGGEVSITEVKEEKLLKKIDELSLSDGRFDEKGMESLMAIKNYYAQLIPQYILKRLDEKLILKIDKLANKENVPNRKIFITSLKSLPLFALDTELKRSDLINRWIENLAKNKKSSETESKSKNKDIISKKKKEYQKRENEGSELVITSFGSFIGKNTTGLTVKVKGRNIHKKPSSSIKHITIISKGVTISSDAIHYCSEKQIPIDFFDRTGDLYASILSPVFVDQSLWLQQATLCLEKKIQLARTIINGKLRNQRNLVKYYHKYHKESGLLTEIYNEMISSTEKLLKQVKTIISNDINYQEKLISIEAQGAVLYWKYIRQLLADDEVDFVTRERKGADDLFNSLLNYGYSLLYSRVWQALLSVKLNPAIGFLHADQSNKPTLSFDMIELFRTQSVDRVVIGLIQTKQPLSMDGILLEEETKKLLIENILERLNRYEKYRGKEIKFVQIMWEQSKELADYIRGESGSLKPYIAKW